MLKGRAHTVPCSLFLGDEQIRGLVDDQEHRPPDLLSLRRKIGEPVGATNLDRALPVLADAFELFERRDLLAQGREHRNAEQFEPRVLARLLWVGGITRLHPAASAAADAARIVLPLPLPVAPARRTWGVVNASRTRARHHGADRGRVGSRVRHALATEEVGQTYAAYDDPESSVRLTPFDARAAHVTTESIGHLIP